MCDCGSSRLTVRALLSSWSTPSCGRVVFSRHGSDRHVPRSQLTPLFFHMYVFATSFVVGCDFWTRRKVTGNQRRRQVTANSFLSSSTHLTTWLAGRSTSYVLYATTASSLIGAARWLSGDDNGSLRGPFVVSPSDCPRCHLHVFRRTVVDSESTDTWTAASVQVPRRRKEQKVSSIEVNLDSERRPAGCRGTCSTR